MTVDKNSKKLYTSCINRSIKRLDLINEGNGQIIIIILYWCGSKGISTRNFMEIRGLAHFLFVIKCLPCTSVAAYGKGTIII